MSYPKNKYKTTINNNRRNANNLGSLRDEILSFIISIGPFQVVVATCDCGGGAVHKLTTIKKMQQRQKTHHVLIKNGIPMFVKYFSPLILSKSNRKRPTPTKKPKIKV